MNDLWGICLLLTTIAVWWVYVIAYITTEDLVVNTIIFVACEYTSLRDEAACVIRRMRRIWHAVGDLQSGAALLDARLYTGPITGARAVAIIAREQWMDENNITRNRCRRRLRPELDAGGSRPPRHQ
jgi:hypothetical protein